MFIQIKNLNMISIQTTDGKMGLAGLPISPKKDGLGEPARQSLFSLILCLKL